MPTQSEFPVPELEAEMHLGVLNAAPFRVKPVKHSALAAASAGSIFPLTHLTVLPETENCLTVGFLDRHGVAHASLLELCHMKREAMRSRFLPSLTPENACFRIQKEIHVGILTVSIIIYHRRMPGRSTIEA